MVVLDSYKSFGMDWRESGFWWIAGLNGCCFGVLVGGIWGFTQLGHGRVQVDSVNFSNQHIIITVVKTAQEKERTLMFFHVLHQALKTFVYPS